MAIQLRRGAYENFDPAKMLPGEPAAVLSGDPRGNDGKGLYVAFAAGDVKRMASMEDAAGIAANAVETMADVIEAAVSDSEEAAEAARDAAEQATQAGDTAGAAAERAIDAAEAAEGVVLDAVPTMSATVKGGAKVGPGLKVTNAVLSVDASTVASGVLPVSQGGTGVTSAASERQRLGLGSTTGALPIANGGTGAATAATALDAITAGSPLDINGQAVGIGTTAPSSGLQIGMMTTVDDYLIVTGDMSVSGTLDVGGETVVVDEDVCISSSLTERHFRHRNNIMDASYNATIGGPASCTFDVQDRSNRTVAQFAGRQLASGEKQAVVEACGFDANGVSVECSILAQVDKAGNRSYELSDPAAFRSALNMRSGTVAPESVAAGGSRSENITFDPALPSAPNVVCVLRSTQTQLMGECSCVVTACSATGFTVAMVNNSTSARNLGCYWIAM